MEQIIKRFMQKGFLVDQNLVKIISNNSVNEILSEFIGIIISFNPPKIISKDFFFDNIDPILKQIEIKSKISEEKQKFVRALDYLKQFNFEVKKPLKLELKQEEKEVEKDEEKESFFRGVRILESFCIENRKVTVEDFVKYFKDRYNSIKNFLLEHDLRNLTSINKISEQRQNVTIIGIIYSIHTTKNKNLLIEVEDLTGRIRVLVRRDKEELFKKAKEIVLDEVIAINGSGSNEILFVNDIVFPEALLKESKKLDKEVYAIFTADLHYGSNNFLEKNFLKFVEWLNGKIGNDKQKEIAKKVKYLFLVGDIVDGVGIYPNQQEELIVDDVYDQYDKVAELLGKIRKDVTIIMCPGNHDAVRIVEPQPQFNEKIAKKLYALKNVLLLTNPCCVNIASSKKFSGFNIFMYHGASFDYYANDVEVLRLNSPYKRPEIIINFLLKKRHIAPTHSSTSYFPCERDSLVLRKVPDIFVSAHVHKSSISHYNKILVLSCSCWQARTSYQEKFGHIPDPCKVPILNLKTGKVNVIDFS
jgi:DNA polymerase II small subunit